MVLHRWLKLSTACKRIDDHLRNGGLSKGASKIPEGQAHKDHKGRLKADWLSSNGSCATWLFYCIWYSIQYHHVQSGWMAWSPLDQLETRTHRKLVDWVPKGGLRSSCEAKLASFFLKFWGRSVCHRALLLFGQRVKLFDEFDEFGVTFLWHSDVSIESSTNDFLGLGMGLGHDESQPLVQRYEWKRP